MNKQNLPDIFEYNDYRKFLADYFSEKKNQNPNYSHRLFARQAGLGSPSYLLMIIKGDRNLSMKTLQKFCDGLNLTSKERRYFELIVKYEQTDDLSFKAQFFSEILSLRASSRPLKKLEQEKFNFLSKWHVVAIYVLMELKDFVGEPEWIANRLGGKVTTPRIKSALETLEKLGLVEKDPDRGFRQVAGALTVPDDTRSMAVFSYHESMARLASEALRKNKLSDREMNGATIAIPKDKLPVFKEKIREFRKEINQLASTYTHPDHVYQLNIQLFALTQMEEK